MRLTGSWNRIRQFLYFREERYEECTGDQFDCNSDVDPAFGNDLRPYVLVLPYEE